MTKITCSGCGRGKPPACFHRDSRRPTGRTSRCKDCRNAAARESFREAYAENPSKFIKKSVEWEKNHPVSSNERKRRWQAANPKAWKGADRDLARIRRKRWADRNRPALAEAARRRRAKIRGLSTATIPQSLIEEKVGVWGWSCWICGDEPNEIDHVKPIGAGGAHALCNLRPICGACNRKKSAQWPFPSSSHGAMDALYGKGRSDGSAIGTNGITRHSG